MSIPLLSTKFNIPPTGVKFVRRQRLSRILDEGLVQTAPLILVCGPAGYGKTTLVSEWLQTSPEIPAGQFAWLTLESGDDDLARFLTYFVTALQRIRPGFGEGVLKMLQTHKPQPPAVLATLIINELSEIPGRLILILDDYHLLTAQPIQSFMTFLVDHQPPQLALVLVTRSDPALPLARLRARGQLVELRQNALCFLPAEVAEFTNQHAWSWDFLLTRWHFWQSRLRAGSQDFNWLRFHSARGKTAPLFLKAFSGEHEFIADYLAEEVLAHLPEPVRSFLLHTSILERLSAPLCEAVTGQPGAQAMLQPANGCQPVHPAVG